MTPIETAINTAWQSAFQPTLGGKPNPNYIPNILAADPALADLVGQLDTTGNIDLCISSDGSLCPQGAAVLNFTGMTIAYGNLTAGSPIFAADDSTVQLPMIASSVSVSGTYEAFQSCGIASIVGCSGNNAFTQTGGFTLTMNTDTITLDCTINASDAAVVLTSVAFLNTGGSSASTSGSGPSWLDWLQQLFDQQQNVGSGILNQLSNLLSSSQLDSAMQTAINQLLGSNSGDA